MADLTPTACWNCRSRDLQPYGGAVARCRECGLEWSGNSGTVSAIELLGISRAVCEVSPNLAARIRRAADELIALERPTDGCLRILVERRRQIEVEGRSPDADVAYENDELAKAAACYALPITDDRRRDVVIWGGAPEGWPFAKEAWKPATVVDAGEGEAAVRSADRIRELEKAGALIAAEIDRLARRLERGPGR